MSIYYTQNVEKNLRLNHHRNTKILYSGGQCFRISKINQDSMEMKLAVDYLYTLVISDEYSRKYRILKSFDQAP